MKIPNADLFYPSLHGYVFPYLEVSGSTIYRCIQYQDSHCCFKIDINSGDLEIDEKFDSCPRNPLNLIIDFESNKVLRGRPLPMVDELSPYLRNYALVWSPDPFEILISAVLSQNTSFRAFRQMLKRFVRSVGIRLKDNLYAFPHPSEILGKRNVIYQLALGYRSKVIVNLAEYFLHNEPPKDGSTADVIKELTKLKGIGIYTATSYTLFHLRRYDTPLWDRFIATEIFGKLLNLRVEGYRDYENKSRELWGDLRGLVVAALVSVYYQMSSKKNILEHI